MKTYIQTLIITVCLTSASAVAAEAAEEEQDMAVPPNPTNQVQLSARALELVNFYQPPPRQIFGKYQPQALLPPRLIQEHLNEEYRSAWEELLVASASSTVDHKILFIRGPIYAAIDRIADSDSIPAVAKAFRLVTETDKEQYKVDRIQEQCIGILLTICNEEALEAILVCLDLDDKRYDERGIKRDTILKGLREWTLDVMLQLDYRGESDRQQPAFQKARKWKELIQKYNKPGLSENNREFIEKVKGAKHLDEPLPEEKDE